MWTPLAITQRNDGAHSPPRDIGLYIHIPFCHTKCPYCDFNTYAGIETLMPGYIEALAREIRGWGALLGAPQVNTIFFGGGTPSYVPRQAIADILAAVHDVFRVAPDAEVTIEANPGDLLDGDTASLRESGVNRLSIGVQSLDDSLLETLGRRHNLPRGGDGVSRGATRRFRQRQLRPDVRLALPEPGRSGGTRWSRHWSCRRSTCPSTA